jgi:hypothetical protein
MLLNWERDTIFEELRRDPYLVVMYWSTGRRELRVLGEFRELIFV